MMASALGTCDWTCCLLAQSRQGADIDSPELAGIIPRITEQIFTSIIESDASIEYLVKVSYMEIYLERIRDLLARECTSTSNLYSPAPYMFFQPRTIIYRFMKRSRKVSMSKISQITTSVVRKRCTKSCARGVLLEWSHQQVKNPPLFFSGAFS